MSQSPDAKSPRPEARSGHQPRLQFWYDFASNYSWIAARRIQAAARDAGVALQWKPFLLGPIFAASGWNDSPFNVYPAKGAYAWRDVARLADGLGLALTRPQPFPQNSLQAARLALALPEAALPAFTVALFAAEFEQGLGLSEAALRQALAAASANMESPLAAASANLGLPLAAASASLEPSLAAASASLEPPLAAASAGTAGAPAAGLDLAAALAAAGSDAVKRALRAQTEAAVAAGIFGAPAFIASDGELFWGNDRLEQALAWELGLADR
ncbi:2-hydroxychromene-2-carboxylate isomerase [Camelimonas lactis]|uniref:2-hydroxychromene-2-carboxylate isomerase n=1 Tax=Camelimonas lactis TaxID=659006 RepID=A0A4R2GU76_9HYPH|nr:DsbA family protein [Camelimonas lactis]TCO12495.1 2-hydroxychromene-2-carboxylate isomerase [Camelimonas lactis]